MVLGFNYVDLIIVFLALAAIIRGIEAGFFRQTFSLAGFFVGLFMGSWIAPHITPLAGNNQLAKLGLTVFATLGMAFTLSGIAEGIARRIQLSIKAKPLLHLEKIGGAAVSVLSVVLTVWLMASVMVRLPSSNIAPAVNDSKIIRALDKKLPPAPAVMARLGEIINPGSFPRAFTGIEPYSPNAGAPSSPEVEAAALAAAASTVRVEGIACNSTSSGSGFVIEEGLIATNAHVVAGVENPYIVDQLGMHKATTVWFDPDLDFALLSVSKHKGPPLALDTRESPRGLTAAALGFPGGGDFTVKPAVVLSRHTAVGRNIYDSAIVQRDIYELQSSIEQGNSGGPLVLPDGRVIGLIFAKSALRDDRGYAITSIHITEVMEQIAIRDQRVSTGKCLKD